MMTKGKGMRFLLLLLVGLFAAACGGGAPPEGRTLRIVSGSENETLEPIITSWAEENDYTVEITYQGSVDISRALQTGNTAFDAVWPANTLWLNYGDTQGIVEHVESIMRSPVVLGVKRSVAESLGWMDVEVTMSDILDAAERGDLRFMMTSATQSNSGASFYFAALSAFAGSPEVIGMEDLENPEVQDQVKRILGTVDRSSGSSGWLRDLFLQTYDVYDGMVNYESVIIEANQELERQGREPLVAIYPSDGLAIADSPLGFIGLRDDEKEASFLALQTYLLSDGAQSQLLARGRRAGNLGLQLVNVDTSVFRPEWNIDVDRVIQPIRFPNTEVIGEALDLYQTAFRRPSCTVIAIDRSGSMDGDPERDANAGVRTILNQTTASQYLIQATANDITTVMMFSDDVINTDYENWTVYGNDEAELNDLYTRVERQDSSGGTNIFGTIRRAHEWMNEIRTDECLPAVILMTDGEDTIGENDRLARYLDQTENDIPVFVITFGSASEDQIGWVVERTFGRIFDGREDLIGAFRAAKGYN
jgi:Ca-activated chloride channel family protein